MAASNPLMSRLARSMLLQSTRRPASPSPICMVCQLRSASGKPASRNKAAKSGAGGNAPAKKKKKEKTRYRTYNLKDADQFSLVDAMRYIRAFEVGYPSRYNYEVAVRLGGLKNAPAVRNRLRLPHPIQSGLRICVICPPDSPHATAAKEAGATVFGEEAVFEDIRNGNINFDKCLCIEESLPKLNKAGLGRILGPKGLMPSTKMGTIIKNVKTGVSAMIGATEYRENGGVVRAQLASIAATPAQLKANLTSLIASIKKDVANIDDTFEKSVQEVVLSSTHGPGLTLSGDFQAPDSTRPEELVL